MRENYDLIFSPLRLVWYLKIKSERTFYLLKITIYKQRKTIWFYKGVGSQSNCNNIVYTAQAMKNLIKH